MTRSNRGWKLSWMVVICLLAGLLSSGFTTNAAYGADSEIPKIIERVSPSVVAIIGKPSDDKETENDRFNLAHGTGVIVKANGVILTNAHVVKGMKNIVVVTSDGKTYPGKTTHFDEESDLALIKIEAFALPTATFAAPSDIRVGETVMAIGTPISFALRNSVTLGIISGIDRSVESKYQLLQTDAAINPGNSGGALVNMQGKVVGINSLKFVDYSVESMGFAIPVNTVQYVLEHFEKYGKVLRPYMGIELEESWEAVVGLPAKEGLKVSYVDPDSPAAKAGIKQGDAIVSIDQSSITTLVEYNEFMKKYLPKDTIRITMQSDGQTVVRSVVLEEDTESASQWTQDSDGSYIDNDQGKTHIGDSHYGWSMKYPAGLVKSMQTDEGDRVIFGDAKGEFMISISVDEEQSEDLSVKGLLRKLTNDFDDSILEKRYIEQKPYSYAKLVGQSNSKNYYQVRAFLKGDKIYHITLIVENEENYKNKVKHNFYNDLLDSFTLSFDAKDTSLKDISIYKDGDAVFTNEYGLSFELPSGWSGNEYSSELSYSNEDYDQHVEVYVTSASSGETLADWTVREEQQFKDRFVADYRQIGNWEEFTTDGVVIRKIRFASKMGGDEWESEERIYLIKDKYKYEINVGFKNDTDDEEVTKLIAGIIKSIKVNKEDMNTNLGFIQDEDDITDKNKTIKYTNEKFKYSIQIPETWYSYSDFITKDSPRMAFTFYGGMVSVEANDKLTVENVVKKLEEGHKKSNENDKEFTYEITDDSTYSGEGKKVSIRYNLKKAPYTQTEYVFNRNNITYTITIKMNDAVSTEENVNRSVTAANSIMIKE